MTAKGRVSTPIANVRRLKSSTPPGIAHARNHSQEDRFTYVGS
jgi:hypothetical protein